MKYSTQIEYYYSDNYKLREKIMYNYFDETIFAETIRRDWLRGEYHRNISGPLSVIQSN